MSEADLVIGIGFLAAIGWVFYKVFIKIEDDNRIKKDAKEFWQMGAWVAILIAVCAILIAIAEA